MFHNQIQVIPYSVGNSVKNGFKIFGIRIHLFLIVAKNTDVPPITRSRLVVTTARINFSIDSLIFYHLAVPFFNKLHGYTDCVLKCRHVPDHPDGRVLILDDRKDKYGDSSVI